jgi:Fe-S-cluster containining protein
MRFDYPPNLRFKCSKCGLCCGDTQQKKRHVLLLKSDAERIASNVKTQINEFAKETVDKAPYVFEMQKEPLDGKCIFLKEDQCTIYEIRPLICRFYPFELSTDKEGFYTFNVTVECPGIFGPSTKGVGKRLDSSFFRTLLEMARVEFDVASC